MEMLGHSDIQTTVNIYGKWIQTERSAGVNRLNNQPKTHSNPHPIRAQKIRKAVTS